MHLLTLHIARCFQALLYNLRRDTSWIITERKFNLCYARLLVEPYDQNKLTPRCLWCVTDKTDKALQGFPQSRTYCQSKAFCPCFKHSSWLPQALFHCLKFFCCSLSLINFFIRLIWNMKNRMSALAAFITVCPFVSLAKRIGFNRINEGFKNYFLGFKKRQKTTFGHLYAHIWLIGTRLMWTKDICSVCGCHIHTFIQY